MGRKSDGLAENKKKKEGMLFVRLCCIPVSVYMNGVWRIAV